MMNYGMKYEVRFLQEPEGDEDKDVEEEEAGGSPVGTKGWTA